MKKDNKPLSPRKDPSQARSRVTVQSILEGAARVFRRDGWNATTNRIAEEAGVSIGTLYEYFPNKQALLLALAGAHMELAERSFSLALDSGHEIEELFTAIQTAVLTSQRFPSHALTLVQDVKRVGPKLRARATALEQRVLACLTDHAKHRGLDEPELRARVCFDLIGDLTARSMYTDPERASSLARHYRELALRHMGGVG
jgi:AcrR family transcriptional regulator